jgi:hypothetical protein
MMMSSFQQQLLQESFLSPLGANNNRYSNQQKRFYQQQHETSTLELSVKERAYEVFGIGLAAAEAWMSAASSWMTRFNTFKALLLFESCRATEAQALKHAAWLRRTLMMSPTALNNNGRSPHLVSSPANSAQQAAADRWAQFMLVIRFSDWIAAASDSFAWSFDAVVSVFFDALCENRLAIGATDANAMKRLMSPPKVQHQHQPSTKTGVARAIFSSPCSADGGDEFLLLDLNFCSIGVIRSSTKLLKHLLKLRLDFNRM